MVQEFWRDLWPGERVFNTPWYVSNIAARSLFFFGGEKIFGSATNR